MPSDLVPAPSPSRAEAPSGPRPRSWLRRRFLKFVAYITSPPALTAGATGVAGFLASEFRHRREAAAEKERAAREVAEAEKRAAREAEEENRRAHDLVDAAFQKNSASELGEEIRRLSYQAAVFRSHKAQETIRNGIETIKLYLTDKARRTAESTKDEQERFQAKAIEARARNDLSAAEAAIREAARKQQERLAAEREAEIRPHEIKKLFGFK